MILELPKAKIERVPINDRRHYHVHGHGIFPSVTTILKETGDKEWLKKWKARVGEEEAAKIGKKAAARGTVMHKLLEIYLDQDLSLSPNELYRKTLEIAKTDEEVLQGNREEIKIGLTLFRDFYKDQNRFFSRFNDVLLQEVFLWSIIAGGYAGTVDNFSIIDNKFKVIDFKTALKPKREEYIEKYKFQCSAYAIAIWERFGIKVDGCEIWIANEVTQPQIFTMDFDEIRDCFKVFTRKVKQFHAAHPLPEKFNIYQN